MKNEMLVKKVLWYTSEVNPQVQTASEEFAKIIEWADELLPIVYRIVNSSKCKTYGLHANIHLGWARGSELPEAILTRIERLKQDLDGECGEWFSKRAKFSVDHFTDKSFSSGMMQQYALWSNVDKTEIEYPRHCCDIDYTPDTLESVIDGFVEWMNHSCAYENTTRITLDGKNVRTFEPAFSRLQELEKDKPAKPARGRLRKESPT